MTRAISTRASQRAASVRTALALALVAFGFFGSIIAAQWYGPSIVGLVALGLAIVGFPLAAMAGKARA